MYPERHRALRTVHGAQRSVLTLALVALLAACGERGRSPSLPSELASSTPSEVPVASKTPMTPTTFDSGPSIDDTSQLRAWLDATAPPGGVKRRVRLPVVITRTANGITSAYVGTHPDKPAAEAMHLRLDDTALGVSLADRLRERFGADASPVVVWLDGVRAGGTALEDHLIAAAGGPADGWPFALRAVGEPVAPTDAARAYVQHME